MYNAMYRTFKIVFVRLHTHFVLLHHNLKCSLEFTDTKH